MTLFLALFLFAQQDFTQRGFVEVRSLLYPQDATNDPANATGEALLRHEAFYRPLQSLQAASAVDVRTDTHHQVEREFDVSWDDRELKRPLFSIRRLSLAYYRGGLTVEAGKQFIRWGKTDIVNPTDRFAPRDYLAVVDNDFLAVLAVRGTYERGANTIDVVWAPRFTPSRVPLVDHRWVVVPEGTPIPPVIRSFPDDSQAGIRWSYVGAAEFSLAYYEGFNHLPSLEFRPEVLAVHQFNPRLRMIGGDAAVPLRWVTAKFEAARFSSPDERTDEYVLYVVQLERQTGEWFFVGGYAGEWVTEEGIQATEFAPDRGLVRTLLGRAGYTIDANRNIAFEAAVRDNADGLWIKAEYSQAFGQHWRLTGGFTLIRGDTADFLGQYRRNSHGLVAIKYSF